MVGEGSSDGVASELRVPAKDGVSPPGSEAEESGVLVAAAEAVATGEGVAPAPVPLGAPDAVGSAGDTEALPLGEASAVAECKPEMLAAPLPLAAREAELVPSRGELVLEDSGEPDGVPPRGALGVAADEGEGAPLPLLCAEAEGVVKGVTEGVGAELSVANKGVTEGSGDAVAEALADAEAAAVGEPCTEGVPRAGVAVGVESPLRDACALALAWTVPVAAVDEEALALAEEEREEHSEAEGVGSGVAVRVLLTLGLKLRSAVEVADKETQALALAPADELREADTLAVAESDGKLEREGKALLETDTLALKDAVEKTVAADEAETERVAEAVGVFSAHGEAVAEVSAVALRVSSSMDGDGLSVAVTVENKLEELTPVWLDVLLAEVVLE